MKIDEITTRLTTENEKIVTELKQNGRELEVNRDQFSLSLKTWRLRMGLTQAQVGKRWGCSRYTILRAERGKNLTWEMAYRLFARLSHELRTETITNYTNN